MQLTNEILAHAAATWAMVGLIWMVQLVQYPGFKYVGSADFLEFHERYSRRITWIVAPLMGTELLTGLALMLDQPKEISSVSMWFSLGLIGVNWTCTAFVSMPLHARLSRGDRSALPALVRTNWIRTVAWTARGLWVLSVML